ncbi:MAG TPA: glutamine synthetase adenylyltransferase, partial [Chloroflexi bacterium]|nr:glutamine synthetase adenylyltransferase [Chloroflexota bacterium]
MSDRSVSGESAQLTADLTVDHWSDERVGRLLREAGFQDWRSASRRLARIVAQAREPAASTPLLPFLLAALSDVPNPDYVLVTLERFLQHAASSPHRADRLLTQPRAIEILVRLFAGSQFLAEILLRNPEYLEMLLAHRRLTQPKTLAQFTALNADETAEEAGTPGSVAVLCRYQRWEILRIGACDLLGLLDLSAVTAQLSALADNLIQAGLELASRQTGIATSGFAVLAMGK